MCCAVLLHILLLRRRRAVVVLPAGYSRGVGGRRREGGRGASRGLAVQGRVPAEQLRQLGGAAAQRVARERPALQVGRRHCSVGVHARVARLDHHVRRRRHKAQRPLPGIPLRQPETDGDVVLRALVGEVKEGAQARSGAAFSLFATSRHQSIQQQQAVWFPPLLTWNTMGRVPCTRRRWTVRPSLCVKWALDGDSDGYCCARHRGEGTSLSQAT